MLNDRQIASLMWLGLLVLAALAAPSFRSSIGGVARAFLKLQIVTVFTLLGVWSVGLVFLGLRLGIWTDALAADTWFWFFTTAAVLLFNFDQANKEPDFFLTKAKETFGISLVLGFLFDVYVLPLPIEFLGQGVVAVLAIGSAAAASQKGSEQVHKLANGCLGVLGLVLLALALLRLITSFSSDEAPDLIRDLLMPAWMTLGVLPFIYAVALYAAFEQVFKRIDLRTTVTRRAQLRAQAAVLLGLRFRTTRVTKFTWPWASKAADAPSFREALQVTRDFKNHLRQEDRAKQDAADRLIRFAGVEGVDEDGRRLDRREFAETTRALRWIGTCQMGWGRRETGYRADVLDVLGDLSAHGLPGDGGIEVQVAADGSAWYAWRQTVGGWVFAIGSAGPPPDQWEYDGPDPPRGFPGSSSEWGSGPFRDDANRNW